MPFQDAHPLPFCLRSGPQTRLDMFLNATTSSPLPPGPTIHAIEVLPVLVYTEGWKPPTKKTTIGRCNKEKVKFEMENGH